MASTQLTPDSKMPSGVDGSEAQPVAEHGLGDRHGSEEGVSATLLQTFCWNIFWNRAYSTTFFAIYQHVWHVLMQYHVYEYTSELDMGRVHPWVGSVRVGLGRVIASWVDASYSLHHAALALRHFGTAAHTAEHGPQLVIFWVNIDYQTLTLKTVECIELVRWGLRGGFLTHQ